MSAMERKGGAAPVNTARVEGVTGEATGQVLHDERSVRVVVAVASRLDGDTPLTIAPALRPILGATEDRRPVVDGARVDATVQRFDDVRARLAIGAGGDPAEHRVLLGELRPASSGPALREVVVDGWRVELELEPERRAALRERARRGHEATGHGGPMEVHAIIPGRVVAVSVKPGDLVEAGQQILVVEAMKMQNELRSPRDGTIDRVGVSVGQTIEVGDLLAVIS